MIQFAPVDDVSNLMTDNPTAGTWELDPTGSRAEFHVKNFWGAMTVRGTFGRVAGEAAVGPGGTAAGRITFDARSLDTGNALRDRHLGSAAFFDVDEHPEAVLTVTSARLAGPRELECHGTFAAAGHVKPVWFSARVSEVSARAAALTATLELDRSQLGMTWSPLRMTSMRVVGVVRARFSRTSSASGDSTIAAEGSV